LLLRLSAIISRHDAIAIFAREWLPDYFRCLRHSVLRHYFATFSLLRQILIFLLRHYFRHVIVFAFIDFATAEILPQISCFSGDWLAAFHIELCHIGYILILFSALRRGHWLIIFIYFLTDS
jgi:hypothetical protein